MSIRITQERPDTADAIALITELDHELDLLYPSDSQHGFSTEKLIAEAVAFFLLYYNEMPAGCGGVKLVGADYGEIKRLYIRPQFRGLGLSKAMLQQLETHTRQQEVFLLRLETGIHQPEAIGLYERVGFRRIPPFGSYKEDPLSIFYEKVVA